VEGLRDIGRAELDNDLLATGSRIRRVFETEVGVEAIRGTCFEDLGEYDGGEGIGLEEETDECAIDDGLLDQRRFRELYNFCQY
jgi:hypothetical protein